MSKNTQQSQYSSQIVGRSKIHISIIARNRAQLGVSLQMFLKLPVLNMQSFVFPGGMNTIVAFPHGNRGVPHISNSQRLWSTMVLQEGCFLPENCPFRHRLVSLSFSVVWWYFFDRRLVVLLIHKGKPAIRLLSRQSGSLLDCLSNNINLKLVSKWTGGSSGCNLGVALFQMGALINYRHI